VTAGGTTVPLYPYKGRVPAPLYYVFRAVRTLTVAFCFAGFWGVGALVAWLWMPLVRLWPGPPAVKLRRTLRVMRRGFQFFHGTMRVLRLYHRVSTSRTLRPGGAPADGPCVLVANHPTLCDTTSILSLFPDVVAVARPGLANHPLYRRALAWCGFVAVGPHIVRDCVERLRMGFDVLIFPEGTRSPQGPHLHPFHRGAFEIAARAGVPVVLLKLTCAPAALSKRLPIWKIPDKTAVLTIEPFDVIRPADVAGGSKALAAAIEQRYREVLGYPAAAVAAATSSAGE
jgi:1-acyl-sn-glycerol-3-phosphate acyltransferase